MTIVKTYWAMGHTSSSFPCAKECTPGWVNRTIAAAGKASIVTERQVCNPAAVPDVLSVGRIEHACETVIPTSAHG
jgi:hypothetical protein